MGPMMGGGMKILVALLIAITAGNVTAWLAGCEVSSMTKTITVCAMLNLLVLVKD